MTDFYFADESAMLDFAARAGEKLPAGLTIYLHGTLGMGKTTFTRGLLQGLGHSGKVKSPTYTLVEAYDFLSPVLYHFDLYRLADPEELEYLGIRDYLDGKAVSVIEWPEKGAGILPPADLDLTLSPWQQGRCLQIVANTPAGKTWLAQLQQQ